MVERRSLVEGLKSSTPEEIQREQDFVRGGNARPVAHPEPVIAAATSVVPSQSRSPLSTRIRSDFATALKRASLERQLSQTEPNTLQDILEEAIEPWLKAQGYLT